MNLDMNCTAVLNMIGNIASIITVIGGTYGLCQWIKSRKANIIANKYHNSDQGLFILYVYNEGLAEAHDIKISSVFNFSIQTSAYISKLLPGEEGQIGFSFRHEVTKLPIYIHWTDGMGRHKKRVNITPSMRIR